MARAVWTGSLSFGLVNVPVALFAATEEKTIRFNQFQAGTSARVRNKRVNAQTGDEVPFSEIAKGYDVGGGEYVMLSADEIAAVAPGRSKTIDVSAFVDLAEIDPVYFDRTYYLAPPVKGAGGGAERAYALLREAMFRAQRVALATFVMREKQYLVAIRPREDALVMETLLYADEVRDPLQEIDTLPVEGEWSAKELEMAAMLIESMTSAWDPAQFHDVYRERLEALIDQKRSGELVSAEGPAPQGAPVVDLLGALEASVRAARGGGGAAAPPAGARARPGAGGGAGAAAPIGAAPARPSEDLSAMNKAQLLARAAELGVAGRSKMTRRELEVAVRAAAPVRRRKAS